MPAGTSDSSASSRPPKVLVVGFGALGALYSWLLSKGGAEIYALARSNAQTLSSRGIDIRSQKYGDEAGFKVHKVLSSPKEVQENGPYDYVLCTIKIVPEEEKTGQLILKLLRAASITNDGTTTRERRSKPAIVFVENGIGIEEEPYETLCQGPNAVASTIISCCAWLGATLADGGTAVVHGSFERLQMGLYPAPNPEKDEAEELSWRREKLQVFADTYARGGGGAEMVLGDIQPSRWKKLFWNAAWGGLTTLARQPVSVMLQDENLPYTASVVRKIMQEVMQVARACGIDESALPNSGLEDVFQLTYSQAPSILPAGVTPNLTEDFKPSLLVDLEANRGMELSPIIENVIKKGQQHGVDTPRLEVILAALRPLLMKTIKRRDG